MGRVVMGDDVGHYSDISGQIDESYVPAIWPLLPAPVVRTAGFIVGVTFLVVLLIAVRPWTFGSAAPSSPSSFQFGSLTGAGGGGGN